MSFPGGGGYSIESAAVARATEKFLPLFRRIEEMRLLELLSPELKDWWERYKQTEKASEDYSKELQEAKDIREKKKKEIIKKLNLTKEEIRTLLTENWL